MPKKKRQESQAEQSARFKRDAQKLIDAGELNAAEADAAVDSIVRKILIKPHSDGEKDEQ